MSTADISQLNDRVTTVEKDVIKLTGENQSFYRRLGNLDTHVALMDEKFSEQLEVLNKIKGGLSVIMVMIPIAAAALGWLVTHFK